MFTYKLSLALFTTCSLAVFNPNPDKDRYNWASQNITSPWDVGNHNEHWLGKKDSGSIKEILENPKLTVVDVRYDNIMAGEMNFDLRRPEKRRELNMKAKYVKLDYDDIRHAPYRFLNLVAKANGYPNIAKSHGITPKKPKNTIENLRNKPLIIACGYQWCACRWYYAVWHGFKDVTIVQDFHEYLPGGKYSEW